MRPLLLFFVCLPVLADISGFVRDEEGNPIADARVRVRTSLAEPVITGVDGSFTLSLSGGTELRVTAAVPYNPHVSVNYVSAGVDAEDGDSGVVIVLPAIPEVENDSYFPIKARTPDGCGDCHPTQLTEWENSRHADTAENFWVNDLYEAWTAQNPGQTGFCASCHAPAADSQDPGNIFLDQLGDLPLLDRISAREGVNCSSCHQVDHVNDNYNALHLNGNATMRFPLDGIGGLGTHEYVWGPLDDVTYPFMKAAYQPLFGQSEFCASCHEYTNPNTGAPAQSTYSEWLGSIYGDPLGGQFRSCQDCHMRPGSAPAPLCEPPGGNTGPVRSPVSHARHDIEGTSQVGLAASLLFRVNADVRDGELLVEVEVENHGAGHSFPTGVSVRNAILRVSASDNSGELAQSSGGTVPFYGSDNKGTIEEGDWAGLPGKGFARVLENAQGDKPVLFIDAASVYSDSRIPAQQTDASSYGFALPNTAESLSLDANLTYRRAWRSTVVSMGWQTDARGLPWELELFDTTLDLSIYQLTTAMWADAIFPAGYDGDSNGRIDILDLIPQITRSR